MAGVYRETSTDAVLRLVWDAKAKCASRGRAAPGADRTRRAATRWTAPDGSRRSGAGRTTSRSARSWRRQSAPSRARWDLQRPFRPDAAQTAPSSPETTSATELGVTYTVFVEDGAPEGALPARAALHARCRSSRTRSKVTATRSGSRGRRRRGGRPAHLRRPRPPRPVRAAIAAAGWTSHDDVIGNLIGGRWVEGPQFIENRNPADTRELVGHVRAGDAGRHGGGGCALPGGVPGVGGAARRPRAARCCSRPPSILDGRFEQLAAEMTREEGKTLPEARGEVRRSINILRYFGGEGARLPGLLAPSERDRVFAFAHPQAARRRRADHAVELSERHPRLEAGAGARCREHGRAQARVAAPLSSWRIVEALVEAGVPAGVVNFVAGPGAALGDAMVDGPGAAGRLVHGLVRGRQRSSTTRRRGAGCASSSRWAARTRPSSSPTPTSTGRWPTPSTARSASTGQKCTATSRVDRRERRCYDAFVERLVERTRALKVGNGMDPGIDIGPPSISTSCDTVLRLHRARAARRRDAAVRRPSASRAAARSRVLRRADRLRGRQRADVDCPGGDLRPRPGA